jgi:AraC-like DNA-binding protein
MAKANKTNAAKLNQLSAALAELGTQISDLVGDAGELITDIPELALYCTTAPTDPNSCSYAPSLLVIPQGRKRVTLGRTNYVFGQSQFLLTSVELPIVSQVVTASDENPYLAFFLKLDMSIVRDILRTEDLPAPKPSGPRGMAIGEATGELIRACSRLVDLLDTPRDIPFLGKHIQREIIYRLLQGTQGERLRAIATVGDQNNRTAKVVAWLLANYEKPLRVEELATIAGMSLATLHRHFRALTAMSPLQYQKQLRLRAARSRMLTDDLDASSAAFAVGYESPSQFSREYRRHFGRPPMQDVQALRPRQRSSNVT